jgi:hypothetical protein
MRSENPFLGKGFLYFMGCTIASGATNCVKRSESSPGNSLPLAKKKVNKAASPLKFLGTVRVFDHTDASEN